MGEQVALRGEAWMQAAAVNGVDRGITHVRDRLVAARPCLLHREEEPVGVVEFAGLQFDGVGGVRLEAQQPKERGSGGGVVRSVVEWRHLAVGGVH